MRYDFRCLHPECGEVFEVEKRLDDTTPVACPTCESTNVKKIILQTPLIHVAWKNTLGLGHSGQFVLSSVEAATKIKKEAVDEDPIPAKRKRAKHQRDRDQRRSRQRAAV